LRDLVDVVEGGGQQKLHLSSRLLCHVANLSAILEVSG